MLHTMGGSSRESCTNFMATFLMKKKYRVIICSSRGCNGSKITSKRLYNGYQPDDLKYIIAHISKKYPKAKNKFLMGFSLGSMVACMSIRSGIRRFRWRYMYLAYNKTI